MGNQLAEGFEQAWREQPVASAPDQKGWGMDTVGRFDKEIIRATGYRQVGILRAGLPEGATKASTRSGVMASGLK